MQGHRNPPLILTHSKPTHVHPEMIILVEASTSKVKVRAMLDGQDWSYDDCREAVIRTINLYNTSKSIQELFQSLDL